MAQCMKILLHAYTLCDAYLRLPELEVLAQSPHQSAYSSEAASACGPDQTNKQHAWAKPSELTHSPTVSGWRVQPTKSSVK